MTTTHMRWSEPTIEFTSPNTCTPTIKNHSVTHHDNYLYCFGGYDGRRNHMTLMIYSVEQKKWRQGHAVAGNAPPGRNGHTATLANGERIIIIGGWLGSGPLAASDTHVLDISGGPGCLRWFQPTVRGIPPGPCNMHSADFLPHHQEVYVFRGGNGREYLNDLHALHVDTYAWRKVPTTGEAPQQRANHSSAVLEKELFIFGGWNGKERLNDIHILDTVTGVWSCPQVGGILPHPRAGMTLTALRGRLFLFGGSGTSSKCFHDLQILDRKEMTWLDVSVQEEPSTSSPSPHPYIDDIPPTNCSSPHSSYHKHSDWHSQEHHHDTPLLSHQNAAANPNDEDAIQTISIYGTGPGRRAGHTATAVNRRIYVFGGSCGSDYLSDFFVLDTDPPPQATVSHGTSLQLLERRLKHFFNDEEFSDVTFLVEGRKVYGHRMVLSLVSDCFRAMFTNGFRESNVTEIEIPHCSYQAFVTMMEYIYTGQTPNIGIDVETMGGVERVVELLELADQFFLDHLKQVCERLLQPMVRLDTYEFLLSVAQKTNAGQLENVCRHFERNMDHIVVDSYDNMTTRRGSSSAGDGLW